MQFLNKKILYINVRELNKRGKNMKKEYEMITVKQYVEELENKSNVSNKYYEISVERYLVNMRRNETNEKIVEALLG